ncbi:MAG: hypothetical protein HY800_01715 [Ignavibacteriales bacterium]|nr:hypothetical protein [Ignavibacteriales bacterium]
MGDNKTTMTVNSLSKEIKDVERMKLYLGRFLELDPGNPHRHFVMQLIQSAQ